MNTEKQQLIIVVTDSPDESFARAMGISEERELEIDAILDKKHSETNTYPDCIKEIASEVNSLNELVYACFHLGAFAESQIYWTKCSFQ